MEGQNIDIMNELYKLGIEFLRKQAFSVIILCAICIVLFYMMKEQKNELMMQIITNKAEYKEELRVVSGRLEMCETARANLVIEMEGLKTELKLMRRR